MWGLTDNPVDMLVGFSHVAIGKFVTSFLYEKGHRNVAIITADDARARARCEAFTTTFQHWMANPRQPHIRQAVPISLEGSLRLNFSLLDQRSPFGNFLLNSMRKFVWRTTNRFETHRQKFFVHLPFTNRRS